MSQSFVIGVLLLVALALANLPFLSPKFLAFISLTKKKTGWLCLVELVGFYFLTGALGLFLEKRAGQITSQTWEFYAITGALFVTLAFPGFVYRYLLKPAGIPARAGI